MSRRKGSSAEDYRERFRAGEKSPDVLLSRREAAELAGVHYNSIRAWEKGGELKSERHTIGRREEVRIRKRDLEAFLNLHDSKRRGTSPPRVQGTSSSNPTTKPDFEELSGTRERIVALEAENRVLRHG
jgi:excisionase family DNA binding protein